MKFEIGELVMTVLGDYGIIIGFGRHPKYDIDETSYYHVLINGYIYCYLPIALVKIKNKKKLDIFETICYTNNRSLKKQ